MEVFESLCKLVPTAHATSPSPFNPLSLLPGLFTLTPLTIIAQRTVRRATSLLDPLVLAPGLHLQPTATDLHKGEYPACAALTSGYVFRVENPATVYFLQRVGRTGCLTDLKVSAQASSPSRFLPTCGEALASLGYYTAVGCSVFAAQRVYALNDIWGLFFISNLIFIRLVNFLVLRRRSRPGWFGAPEPGVQVDDLKALTSGTWLCEPTALETFFGAVVKLLVYANMAVAGRATDAGVCTIVAMLLVNSGLLALENLQIRSLSMYGRTMEVVGEPKRYLRRRDLAEQLIRESGRDDWAVTMGLIVKDRASTGKSEGVTVTM
ncbi:MAG: hypothetical protein Q9197_006416 [Variospora fuerteventurae]